jgi:hypothetical protein
MKRKTELIQADPAVIDAGDQFADTLEEVSAVTRYREEMKEARAAQVKRAKEKLKTIFQWTR